MQVAVDRGAIHGFLGGYYLPPSRTVLKKGHSTANVLGLLIPHIFSDGNATNPFFIIFCVMQQPSSATTNNIIFEITKQQAGQQRSPKAHDEDEDEEEEAATTGRHFLLHPCRPHFINCLRCCLARRCYPESYADHTPSTCTGAADKTTFSFEYPGVNDVRSGTILLNHSNRICFLQLCPTLTMIERAGLYASVRGETCTLIIVLICTVRGCHLKHPEAPWIDEVHQSVSVNNYLNFGASPRCNGHSCPANFVHGAGTYQRDSPDTDVPFYSPSLAKYCSGNSCTFAAWGQQAHVPTIFTSSVMTFKSFQLWQWDN